MAGESSRAGLGNGTLSRTPVRQRRTLSRASCTQEQLLAAQQADPEIRLLQQWLCCVLAGEMPPQCSRDMHVLWQQWRRAKQVLVPRVLKNEVMQSLHDSQYAGHLDERQTLARVRSHFYWPGMSGDVHARVGIDIPGPMEGSPSGHQYILVLRDFNKWTAAFPLDNMEAGTVAKVLVENSCTCTKKARVDKGLIARRAVSVPVVLGSWKHRLPFVVAEYLSFLRILVMNIINEWVEYTHAQEKYLKVRDGCQVKIARRHGHPAAMRCRGTADITDTATATVISTLVSKATDCTDKTKEKMAGLLRQYAETISMSDDDLGRTSVTADSTKEEIETHVQRMLKQGLIEPAEGPWSSPVPLMKTGKVPTDKETGGLPQARHHTCGNRKVRQFLGLSSYYQRFIKGFARVAGPLHELTQKGQEWHRGPCQEGAFKTLKNLLMSTLIFRHPDLSWMLAMQASGRCCPKRKN
ncbi:hypothetical protein T07_13142 [Trichinella nelsoni]|uniref:RNA-directed DNA polymerase n=1 Tax=Trichinella nelsoni TaxID=6336 RepID=A0A0V0RFZ3_9BILA|nr:hypothetical protein T07_13142 [Trichinella nelsoni]